MRKILLLFHMDKSFANEFAEMLITRNSKIGNKIDEKSFNGTCNCCGIALFPILQPEFCDECWFQKTHCKECFSFLTLSRNPCSDCLTSTKTKICSKYANCNKETACQEKAVFPLMKPRLCQEHFSFNTNRTFICYQCGSTQKEYRDEYKLCQECVYRGFLPVVHFC